MTAQLALNLTHDAIDLLHRTDGGWVVLGSAQLAAPDFARKLAALRATAAQIGGMDYHTILIVPESEVLYTSASATGQDAIADGLRVQETLDGATPYTVSELAYDWAVQDDRLRIAVVARETLAEAEAFAEEHGFRPVGFTSIPPEGSFETAPWFGATARAGEIVQGGETRPASQPPIRVTGTLSEAELAALIAAKAEPEPTKQPASEPEPKPTDVAKAEANPAEVATAQPEAEAEEETPADAPVPGFSSRRGRRKAEPAPEPERKQRAAKRRARKQAQAKAEEQAKPAQEPTLKGAAKGKAKGKAKSKPAPTDAEAPATPEDAPPAFASIRARRDTPRKAAKTPDLPPPPTLEEPPLPERAARRTGAETDGDSLQGFVTAAAPSLAARQDDARPEAATPARKALSTLLKRGETDKTTEKTPPKKAEAEAMTVFGARAGQQASGAAPGRGGLVLTGGFILVLLAIGVWAGVAYREQVEAWLYGTIPLPEEVAVLPPVAEPEPVLRPAPVAPAPSEPVQADQAPAVDQIPAAQGAAPQPQQLARLPESIPSLPVPGSAPFAGGAARLPQGLTDQVAAPVAPVPSPAPQPEPLLAEDDEILLDDAEPEIVLLTPEETRARYAATGIWESAPEQPLAGLETEIERLYLAAIDPVVIGADAIDIPRDERRLRDAALPRQANPPPPGVDILLGDNGLVTPTPGGTLNPDGIRVYSGPPPTGIPPRRPGSETANPAPTAEALANARPRPRPEGLSEAAERARLGGRTLAELSAFRPRARPDSVTETFAALQAEAATIAALEADALAAKERAEAAAAARANSSALAITASLVPRPRPAGLAPAEPPVTTASAGPSVQRSQRVAPDEPTPVSVARQATESGLRLNRMNLIGVFGTPNDRRALVRLPSGRLLRLKVGDRIDGGRVADIDDDRLRYSKGGRDFTLEMPRG